MKKKRGKEEKKGKRRDVEIAKICPVRRYAQKNRNENIGRRNPAFFHLIEVNVYCKIWVENEISFWMKDNRKKSR